MISNKNLKIHLAQLNFTVGDLSGNLAKILKQYDLANKNNCDLIIFSELAICGYPCEDLWLKKHFIDECKSKILEIIAFSKNKKCAILIGAPSYSIDKGNETLRNCALLIDDGEIKNIIYKKTLPNYGIFDEKRYFTSANNLNLVNFRNFKFGILICEDIWDERNLYLLKEQDIDGIFSLNASPYQNKKVETRFKTVQKFAFDLKVPIFYVNQIGGQDHLVFDGASFVLSSTGEVFKQLANFCEDYFELNFSKKNAISFASQSENIFYANNLTQNYCAIILGIRDYFSKNNFSKALIGMSGGIDSALVATLAVDALGVDNVKIIALPTKFNSSSSLIDAELCAKNLGLHLEVIDIEDIFQNFTKTLQAHQQISKLALENIQSRIRGNILMAISNSDNSLLLTTGNKSEMACGYATIYGDMNGAFNPIKDIYKTKIYELAKFRNQNHCPIGHLKKTEIIPINIINKEPSAELRFNQKDSDSLPPYDILDQILDSLIEQENSIKDTVGLGFDNTLVNKIAKLILNSEYKRKQSAIGVKISSLSFDRDRRYPITNKYNF